MPMKGRIRQQCGRCGGAGILNRSPCEPCGNSGKLPLSDQQLRDIQYIINDITKFRVIIE